MKLVTSLMNLNVNRVVYLKILSCHKEDEVIDPIIFASTVGLGNRIKKLFPSNLMGMMRSVSVIFYNGDT